MAFIEFKIDTSKTEQSINRIRGLLPFKMRGAVKNTSRKLLSKIIQRTPAPPTPAGQVYIRTGRLREGWQGAAKELGMGVPSIFMPPPRASYYGSPPRERDLTFAPFQERAGPDEVFMIMRNNVPYAWFVETVGPGFPPRGGGVWMVFKSIIETQNAGDFENEIAVAWNSL